MNLNLLETADTLMIVAVGYLIVTVVVFLTLAWKASRSDRSHSNPYVSHIGGLFDFNPWSAFGVCFVLGVVWLPWALFEMYIWLNCRYSDYRYKKSPPPKETYASAAEKAQQQVAARADRSKR